MYEAVVSPGNGGTGRGSRGGSGERQPKGNIHAAPFRPDSAAWSTGTVSSSLRVMGLLAFEDGELGGGADEMGETADHAAGAAVQVAGAAGQGPRLVAVQPQRGLQVLPDTENSDVGGVHDPHEYRDESGSFVGEVPAAVGKVPGWLSGLATQRVRFRIKGEAWPQPGSRGYRAAAAPRALSA